MPTPGPAAPIPTPPIRGVHERLGDLDAAHRVPGPRLERGAHLVRGSTVVGVVLAVDGHGRAGRPVEPEDQPHRCRLAGAVGFLWLDGWAPCRAREFARSTAADESDSFSAPARSAWLKPITWERIATDGMLIGPGPPGYPGHHWHCRCLPRPRGRSLARERRI